MDIYRMLYQKKIHSLQGIEIFYKNDHKVHKNNPNKFKITLKIRKYFQQNILKFC